MEIEEEGFDMEIEKIEAVKRRGGYMIMKIGKGSKLLREEEGEKTLGFVNKIGGDQMYIIVDNIERERDIRVVVLHEIGHLMGVRHIGKGIMNKELGEYCIGEAEVKEVSNWTGWEWEKMNYCIRRR